MCPRIFWIRTSSAATIGSPDAASRAGSRKPGCVAVTALKLLLTGPTSAGLTNEMVTYFHATGLRKIGAGGGDEHEAITVHEAPLDELDVWIAEKQAAGLAIDPKIFTSLWLA